jgi:hypothetical protein
LSGALCPGAFVLFPYLNITNMGQVRDLYQ